MLLLHTRIELSGLPTHDEIELTDDDVSLIDAAWPQPNLELDLDWDPHEAKTREGDDNYPHLPDETTARIERRGAPDDHEKAK